MKIHFCDLCNESVPQADLDEGRARLRKGRVVCAHCESVMTSGEDGPPAAFAPPAPAPPVGEETTIMETAMAPALGQRPARGHGGGFGAGLATVALLVSVGGLLWLHEEQVGRQEELAQRFLDERAAWSEATTSMEDRLTRDLRRATRGSGDTRASLLELSATLDAYAEGQAAALDEVRAGLAGLEERVAGIDELRGALDRTRRELAKLSSTSDSLHDSVRRMGGQLEERATARAEPGPAEAGEPNWTLLLPGLQDPDSGKRWQAVQALGSTQDPAVAKHLAPMLEDDDLFVRMATARLLGDLAAPIGIPALIDALEDPVASVREAAVVSLRSITGRSFQFDPVAREVDRAKRVKAWRDWWEKASDEYLERT